MIKKYWIYGLFIFAVVLFTVTRFTNRKPKPEAVKLSAKTFKTGLGWGYDIYRGNSIFIHQEFMPAVEGTRGFATEADAAKVAQLAIIKMGYEQLPEILLKDLDSLKIAR